MSHSPCFYSFCSTHTHATHTPFSVVSSSEKILQSHFPNGRRKQKRSFIVSILFYACLQCFNCCENIHLHKFTILNWLVAVTIFFCWNQWQSQHNHLIKVVRFVYFVCTLHFSLQMWNNQLYATIKKNYWTEKMIHKLRMEMSKNDYFYWKPWYRYIRGNVFAMKFTEMISIRAKWMRCYCIWLRYIIATFQKKMSDRLNECIQKNIRYPLWFIELSQLWFLYKKSIYYCYYWYYYLFIESFLRNNISRSVIARKKFYKICCGFNSSSSNVSFGSLITKLINNIFKCIKSIGCAAKWCGDFTHASFLSLFLLSQ